MTKTHCNVSLHVYSRASSLKHLKKGVFITISNPPPTSSEGGEKRMGLLLLGEASSLINAFPPLTSSLRSTQFSSLEEAGGG